METTDHGPVRVLTFDRPEKLNALDHGLACRARDAMRAAATDHAVRAIVLTGTGRGFCAGVDLDWLAEMAAGTTDSTPSVEFNEELQRADKPVIAAVNGLAVGVGTTMCLHVDLVVAAESARFRTPFTKIGVAPEIGSSWLLPQQLGYQRAAWMLLSSAWVDAATAVEYGLALEVVGFLLLVLSFLSQVQGSWVLIAAVACLAAGPAVLVDEANAKALLCEDGCASAAAETRADDDRVVAPLAPCCGPV